MLELGDASYESEDGSDPGFQFSDDRRVSIPLVWPKLYCEQDDIAIL